MDAFGKRVAECRKEKNLSQKGLAAIFKTSSHTTIGKYERDEVVPSIEAAKKLASILHTTVGYLLGETADQVLKDPSMLKRLNDIMAFPKDGQDHIIYTIDAMIKAAKINGL